MDDSRSLRLIKMDEVAFERTWVAMRAGVAEGVAPGMVAGLWDARKPDEIQVASHGNRRVYPKELPSLVMEPETVFDLASLTKVMGTAALATLLVERRWIDWSTPLGAILPQANYPGVELRHLLSHTAGFVAWAPLWERMRARFDGKPLPGFSVAERQHAMRELVFAIPPDVRPGSRAVYSDISFLLLGFALEEVTRMRLDRAVVEFVWKPLGIRDAFYRAITPDAARSLLEQVAATEDSRWRGGMLQGQVHDDNCWAMGGYAGHAGAFGSVRDVLQFARAFPKAVSPQVLRSAWTRVSQPPGCSRTLGWDTPSGEEPSAGRLFLEGSVGHLGFTGTSLWMDPAAGIAAAVLTNRVHPTRENPLMKAFRPRIHEALRRDIGR